MTLEELYKIIENRKESMSANSYVASLFKEGNDRIIQKVGEESVEVVIAAKGKSKKRFISELADLWFHTLVLMSKFDIKLDDIESELEKRHAKS